MPTAASRHLPSNTCAFGRVVTDIPIDPNSLGIEYCWHISRRVRPHSAMYQVGVDLGLKEGSKPPSFRGRELSLATGAVVDTGGYLSPRKGTSQFILRLPYHVRAALFHQNGMVTSVVGDASGLSQTTTPLEAMYVLRCASMITMSQVARGTGRDVFQRLFIDLLYFSVHTEGTREVSWRAFPSLLNRLKVLEEEKESFSRGIFSALSRVYPGQSTYTVNDIRTLLSVRIS